MQSTVSGTTLPVLQITLEPGEKLIAETGQMSWMSGPVALHTTTAAAGSRGLWGAITRAVGGGGLFMTEFSAQGAPGLVAFAAKVPGSILPMELAPGRTYMIHRHGFLCGTEGVTLETGFQRSLGAGIFGGDGFILQKVGGPGTAWIELGGEIVVYDLPAGGVLNVHPGHVGMFEDGVSFEITMMKGVRNALFGGEGLFLAKLTGPGRVWLQTLTMPGLAHALEPYLIRDETKAQQGSGSTMATVGAGVAGAVLGSLFGNNSDN